MTVCPGIFTGKSIECHIAGSQRDRRGGMIPTESIAYIDPGSASLVFQVLVATYTFAHLIAPHNPYVFDAAGNIIENVPQTLQFNRKVFTRDKNRGKLEGYVNQLRYINVRTLETIDAILDSGEPRPIIVLQSDHGSSALINRTDDASRLAWERHGVLNALLVPPEAREAWPPTVTVINTYPLLIRKVFGIPAELLPDRIFYSWYEDTPELVDVTEQLLDPAAVARGSADMQVSGLSGKP